MKTKIWIRGFIFNAVASAGLIYLCETENTTALIIFAIILFTIGMVYLFTGFKFKKPKSNKELKKVIPVTFSSKNGEALTEYERGLIIKNRNCPDCQTHDLLEGPSGGMSTNFYCADNEGCGSRFNLAIAGGQLLFADRISDKQPAKMKNLV